MPTGNALLAQMSNTPIIPNSLAFWGMGQMGIAIKGPDAIIYIDPCLSNVVEDLFGSWWYRAYPPPIEPDAVTNATYHFASHEHTDHFDPKTVEPLAKASPAARFVASGWCRDLMTAAGISTDRMIFPKALETVTLPGTSIKLTPIPSAHYEREYDEQKGFRWLGFLIEWNGVVFYHSGDTIVHPGYVETLKSLPIADVAMLPINGRDWYRETLVNATGNLLPEEAARLAVEVGWGNVLAGHNDLYPNNTIPMGSLADAFARYAPRLPYKFLQPGELYYFVK
jgi:L-ascorbate 6-phosphate lactonase